MRLGNLGVLLFSIILMVTTGKIVVNCYDALECFINIGSKTLNCGLYLLVRKGAIARNTNIENQIVFCTVELISIESIILFLAQVL